MKTHKEYLEYKRMVKSFSRIEHDNYVNKDNIFRLCSNNPILKEKLINKFNDDDIINGTPTNISYMKEMEWDIDVSNDNYDEWMCETFIWVIPEMRWEDREGGRPSEIPEYDKGDGEEMELLTEEWYGLVKDSIDNIKLDDGKYVIEIEGGNIIIVDPHKQNKTLLKEYHIKRSLQIDGFINSPTLCNHIDVIYNDRELDNFYHNRPHNLPV